MTKESHCRRMVLRAPFLATGVECDNVQCATAAQLIRIRRDDYQMLSYNELHNPVEFGLSLARVQEHHEVKFGVTREGRPSWTHGRA